MTLSQAMAQTKRVKTTNGHRAERNDQSYACPMPYGGASNELSESHYFSSFAY
jgi:hypothetical protein